MGEILIGSDITGLTSVILRSVLQGIVGQRASDKKKEKGEERENRRHSERGVDKGCPRVKLHLEWSDASLLFLYGREP